MVFSLNIVILLLQVLQCKGAVSVQQDHLIQTAFANEQVNTTCKATFPYKPEYLQFQIIYYRIDSTGNEVTVNTLPVSEMIPPGQENNTATKTYHLHIKPTAHASITDTYYCKAQWHKEIREGFGTFILFRDKGYTEPLFTMLVCLVVITIILAVLSIMGTALLFWKRQVVCPEKCRHVKKCPSQGLEPKHPSGSSESPGSIYTDLEPRQSGVYFVIKKDKGKSSFRKMPAAEVSQQETQREISDIVYENL
ncbi:NFAT activation molecule 1 [Tiliqua scincoides]|uniref:NFAT activation molecule 1 n=1 Tax=Tiliqua scincoides TaxID=71010 RepID=UPI00346279A9